MDPQSRSLELIMNDGEKLTRSSAFEMLETTRSPQAYLMSELKSGKWTTSTFCDLLDLITVWTERPASERINIVHVGFSKPTLALLEGLVSPQCGQVLLTETTKKALPAGFRTSSVPVGELDGWPIFIGLEGWGHAKGSPLKSARGAQVEALEPEGWVRFYLTAHSSDGKELAAVGIYNEATYLAREVVLQSRLRHRIGIARFHCLAPLNMADPCEIVRGAPPWLLVRRFKQMPLTRRVAAALSTNNITAVKDLLRFEIGSLLRIPRLGEKSIGGLASMLLKTMEDGPSQNDKALGLSLDRSLPALTARERDVVCRRLGHNRARQGLRKLLMNTA
jgi:hypothetical protein